MFDPVFLIVLALMAPGFLLLLGVVVTLALRKKPKDQWPRVNTDWIPEPSPKQDADV